MSGFRRRLMRNKKVSEPCIEVAGIKWDLKNLEGGDYSAKEGDNYYYTLPRAIQRASEIKTPGYIRRLPTKEEFKLLIDSRFVFTDEALNSYGTFGGKLELPAVGSWDASENLVLQQGHTARYRTSTDYYLHFVASQATLPCTYIEDGYSVRCVIEALK